MFTTMSKVPVATTTMVMIQQHNPLLQEERRNNNIGPLKSSDVAIVVGPSSTKQPTGTHEESPSTTTAAAAAAGAVAKKPSSTSVATATTRRHVPSRILQLLAYGRRHIMMIKAALLVLCRFVLVIMVVVPIFFGLYFLVASPPLHWFGFTPAPYAGPNSVYLPGGGFSGFWFHLGYLHSIPPQRLHDYDYYCFSAGCLSILSVFMNRSLTEVSQAAFAAQDSWLLGNQSRFELVDYFFDELVPPQQQSHGQYNHLDIDIDEHDNAAHSSRISNTSDNRLRLTAADPHVHNRQDTLRGSNSENILSSFLPRIKVLVTTVSGKGFRVEEATDRQHLKELIIRTTWVPYLTGWGFLSDEHTDEIYLDGGFSRMLHPKCESSLHLPLIWETLIHTFSPGLDSRQVRHLWEAGYSYDDYTLPSLSQKRI